MKISTPPSPCINPVVYNFLHKRLPSNSSTSANTKCTPSHFDVARWFFKVTALKILLKTHTFPRKWRSEYVTMWLNDFARRLSQRSQSFVLLRCWFYCRIQVFHLLSIQNQSSIIFLFLLFFFFGIHTPTHVLGCTRWHYIFILRSALNISKYQIEGCQ